MDLNQYMSDHGVTDTQLAAAIKVSQPYVWRLRRGERTPSIQIAARIERWSGGKVPASSFEPKSERAA